MVGGFALFPFETNQRLDVVRTKGLAPLAARPDQQHTVLLSLRSFSFAFQPLQRKRIAPAILSTLKSLRVFAIKKLVQLKNCPSFFGADEGT